MSVFECVCEREGESVSVHDSRIDVDHGVVLLVIILHPYREGKSETVCECV